jgi:hypothetical protein
MTRALHTAVLCLTCLTACDDLTGTFEPIDVWEVASFSSSRLRATAGETVTVDWSFSTDDPVAYQRLCFLYLYFDGIHTECYDHTTEPAIGPDARSVSFQFGGPVSVYLHAEAEDGRTAEAALEVKDAVDAYLTATIENTHATLPYLGQPQTEVDGALVVGSRAVIDFSQFLAVIDADDDGLIDGIDPLFQPGNRNAFRARTVDLTEGSDGSFGYTQGPWFPAQHPADPTLGFSNLLVFGGAIAVSGEPDTFKGEGGDGTFRRAPTLGFDPIFVQFTYAWRDNGIIDPTDIQVGNLNQGLVTGVIGTGHAAASFGEPHDVAAFTVGEAVWIGGDVKGAEAGHFITPVDTGIATPIATLVTDASWQMPIHRDDELGDGTFVQLLPLTDDLGPE